MTIRSHRIYLSLCLVFVGMFAGNLRAASPGDSVAMFRPVSQEELKMTSEPNAPGAPAIILYREVFRDEDMAGSREYDYFRIKVLTEGGRKYADVEIPYFAESVKNIHARTIKSDGTIVEFNGSPYTKTVVKARGLKVKTEAFAMPAVEVGCVIEYFYTIENGSAGFEGSSWILDEDLFTKAADFSLNPFVSHAYSFHFGWTWRNLPPGTPSPNIDKQGMVRLHIVDVPAFNAEEMMPPEDEMKGRVDFNYTPIIEDSAIPKFWTDYGKAWNTDLEKFTGKPKGLEGIVAEIVGPADPPEVKLRKIYARVQQIHNTSYEVNKTQQEEKRSKETESNKAQDVWKKGYASNLEINWLFLGLIRAAGLEAYGVLAPNRDRVMQFDPILLQAFRLDSFIVLVKLEGKNFFCDPGRLYDPYGLLSWQITGVQAFLLDEKKPTWIQIPVTTPDQAQTERQANLTLTEAGDLEGKLTVTYTGIEAARMRREEKDADATERKKYIEDSVKDDVAAPSEINLTNQPDWKNSGMPLVAEFSLKVPGWAAMAGRHTLISVGLFGLRKSTALTIPSASIRSISHTLTWNRTISKSNFPRAGRFPIYPSDGRIRERSSTILWS
jgi:hypothetical protein